MPSDLDSSTHVTCIIKRLEPAVVLNSVFNDVLGFRVNFDEYPTEFPGYYRVVDLRNRKQIDDGYWVIHLYYQRDNMAYRCKNANEAGCLPGTLEALRAEGVQIVILDSSDIYAEYEPYSYVDDMKEFIDRVSALNKTA